MSGPNNHNNSNSSSTNNSNLPSGIVINAAGLLHDKDSMHHRMPSPGSPPRPGSSDGSTTVSATSSPGIDQQEEREHTMKMKMRIPELAYKVVEEMYNKQSQQPQPTSSKSSSKTPSSTSQHSANAPSSVGPARASGSAAQFQKQNSTTSGSSNGSAGAGCVVEDVSPRKKPRKQNM